MRAALWLLALFGVAVAIALFAGNNQGTVTLFWPPHRLDLSLNLVVLGLLAVFVFLHAALRALAALFDLPRQALRWRAQQKERAMHASLVDAIAQLLSGRFIRARKSAEAALVQEASLRASGEAPAHAGRLRALAHLLAAESGQALQDRTARDQHLKLALEHANGGVPDLHEGTLLRAARWALDDREPDAAIGWLRGLSQGAARRMLTLRLKLKAARLARHTGEALDTARLLAKHRAFSPSAAQSIVRGLATELLNGAHDVTQLQRAWASLEPAERQMPELAIHAAQRLAALGGDAAQVREWLLPVWERQASLSDSLKVKLVRALEGGLDSLDAPWLARIEAAHRANPRDASLQYLAGMACLKRQLWGKAQQLLMQAALGLQDVRLHRSAWRALAELAEERGDGVTAGQAWKRAASE
ncbi:heme biosynthesis HemY N-terminal domain-containing protein [Ramlibacter tataouinensis]|uniref:HemY protein-like protein n=1 Tax=Ramlibacter tataouinensis (strain ATCC BAA-407 / DSM 14655 / LMG 21543 / TTB310) TaxID=365046 RepID=F5Y5T4_RAMTT|nr:heme biosynthesis HemY N-terminal domain-containing protein [Ramlibacter tataouinensis]AEG93968.1 HemY protein-like protein [Ramlibacter tataouinensis TTB310]